MALPTKIGEAIHIESAQNAECEVFGKHIYETTVGRQVFARMTRLFFVVGYYGYGKTFGVGAYVICKLKEQNKKYIYIDLYGLVNSVGKPDLQFLSIRDIISYLDYVLNDSGVPYEKLNKENKIDTNIEDLATRLKQLKSIETSDKNTDYKNIGITDIFNLVFNEVSKEPLYIIVDQLEGVTADLRRSVEELCTEIRQLYDSGKQVYLLLLMQRAKVVREIRSITPECPKDHPARGISGSYILNGYEAEDYEKILRILYNTKEDIDKQLLKKLSILPPRLVFELINKSADIRELTNRLHDQLKKSREELYLTIPKQQELTQIVQTFISNLKLNNYKKIPSKISKLYIYEIKCNKKALKLCIDFRSRRTKDGGGDCDIKLINGGGVLRLGGNEDLVEVGHFLATFSNRQTILKGLEDLYREIQEVVISKVSSEIRSRCGDH